MRSVMALVEKRKRTEAASSVWNLAPAGGPDGPRSYLLNAYQRSALGSMLPIAERAVRLAAAELEAVDARAPASTAAEAERRRQLREAIAEFSRQVDALVAAYGLRPDERDWRVLMLGQLERAHQVLENAAPERLIGFGKVSDELRTTLGADVAGLQLTLRDMQTLVQNLHATAG